MWLCFISHHFESSLVFFFSFSCVLGVLDTFFFIYFFWNWFKRHLEKLMRQFVIFFIFILFFSFGGDPKPFEGNRTVSLTLKSCGLGPRWELLLVYWQLGDISICEITKYKYKHYSSKCFSIALQLCFPTCCNCTACLALDAVGQNRRLVEEWLGNC